MDRRNFLLWGSAVAGGLAVPGISGRGEEMAPAAADPQGVAPKVKTGGTQLIPVRGGNYHVWVKRVGESPIKVLLLHGGPGLSHVYFECFENFLPRAGIEFCYFDQLGSLFSDNPDDPKL